MNLSERVRGVVLTVLITLIAVSLMGGLSPVKNGQASSSLLSIFGVTQAPSSTSDVVKRMVKAGWKKVDTYYQSNFKFYIFQKCEGTTLMIENVTNAMGYVTNAGGGPTALPDSLQCAR